jgi:hypothetical protein
MTKARYKAMTKAGGNATTKADCVNINYFTMV